jgi:NADH:ubiquinone oxidoreductase subunit C
MHVEKYLRELKPKEEHGNIWLSLPPSRLLSVLKHLKLIGLSRISSITGVDNGKKIDVIYHFIHKAKTINIRISVDRKKCAVESITGIYPGANLFERELHEMLGIEVKNHPNLKKLFLSDESPQTPLRKS